MKIVVIGNDIQREEMGAATADAEVRWTDDISALENDADAVVDLLFQNEKGRIEALSNLLPRPVLVSSVVDTLAETDERFVRFNGWPTFLHSPVMEASSLKEELKPEAEKVFSVFSKKAEWLADQPGFITPRVISMIINEAFFALEEGVSTVDEINTAMRLGTAYPYGPFEWAEKIGLENIVALLQKLSAQQPHYSPCKLLRF